ncbi:BatA domain-containing protein [Candidatus Latescibacterota bacterium]
MNFLNSIILFGLGAAVLPLLIHLLSKRSTKEIVFPSIRFLELLKSDRIRMLRIKQLLILLMRTLIIIFIILAFARPALRSVFKADSRTTAVIIVDDSSSMLYVDNGELLFDRALRKGREILNLLREGDSAAVLFTGGNRPDVIPRFYTDKNKLESILNTTENSRSSAEPASSFTEAFDLLKSSGSINKEIYYITDNAANSLPDSIDNIDETVRLYTVSLGPEKRYGTVIGDISLVDKLIAPGKKLTFSVTRYGNFSESSNDIEFFVNGERKGKSGETGLTGDTQNIEFSYIPEIAGWYSINAVVNDGYFEPGEKRRITVYVPPVVKVLLAGGNPSDSFFLEKALTADSDESVFDIKSVQEEDISPKDFVWADVIILSGLTDMPKSEYQSLLSEIVERGKGLIVFPGENVGSALYADGIFRDIFPANIVHREDNIGDKKESYRMNTFDLTHPIFAGISQEGDFVKPESESYLKMISTSQIHVLARFDDNSIAAGITGCGKGKALVFAVSADSDASDFPVSGIFPLIVVRSAQYLSSTLYYSRVYESGDTVSESLGEVSGNTQVTVKPEGKPSVLVEVENSPGGAELTSAEFSGPGFYSVFAGREERVRFSVNAPYSEITFSRAGDIRMTEIFKNIRWRQIGESQNLTDIVTNDRYGKELYGMFMICAIILIGVEMLISRKI